MFWLQLGTLVAINVIIFAMLLLPSSHRQHGNAGEGAYDVWRLIGDVEAERATEYTGRHRLRERPDRPPPAESEESPRTP